MKEDITQIPRIPFFLKLKIVLIPVWELKVSKNRINYTSLCSLGCALFYKPIWQLTVNERGHYADSEDTFLFKIEDSPDTRLGA